LSERGGGGTNKLYDAFTVDHPVREVIQSLIGKITTASKHKALAKLEQSIYFNSNMKNLPTTQSALIADQE
jgi:hypothetical protein